MDTADHLTDSGQKSGLGLRKQVRKIVQASLSKLRIGSKSRGWRRSQLAEADKHDQPGLEIIEAETDAAPQRVPLVCWPGRLTAAIEAEKFDEDELLDRRNIVLERHASTMGYPTPDPNQDLNRTESKSSGRAEQLRRSIGRQLSKRLPRLLVNWIMKIRLKRRQRYRTRDVQQSQFDTWRELQSRPSQLASHTCQPSLIPSVPVESHRSSTNSSQGQSSRATNVDLSEATRRKEQVSELLASKLRLRKQVHLSHSSSTSTGSSIANSSSSRSSDCSSTENQPVELSRRASTYSTGSSISESSERASNKSRSGLNRSKLPRSNVINFSKLVQEDLEEYENQAAYRVSRGANVSANEQDLASISSSSTFSKPERNNSSSSSRSNQSGSYYSSDQQVEPRSRHADQRRSTCNHNARLRESIERRSLGLSSRGSRVSHSRTTSMLATLSGPDQLNDYQHQRVYYRQQAGDFAHARVPRSTTYNGFSHLSSSEGLPLGEMQLSSAADEPQEQQQQRNSFHPRTMQRRSLQFDPAYNNYMRNRHSHHCNSFQQASANEIADALDKHQQQHQRTDLEYQHSNSKQQNLHFTPDFRHQLNLHSSFEAQISNYPYRRNHSLTGVENIHQHFRSSNQISDGHQVHNSVNSFQPNQLGRTRSNHTSQPLHSMTPIENQDSNLMAGGDKHQDDEEAELLPTLHQAKKIKRSPSISRRRKSFRDRSFSYYESFHPPPRRSGKIHYVRHEKFTLKDLPPAEQSAKVSRQIAKQQEEQEQQAYESQQPPKIEPPMLMVNNHQVNSTPVEHELVTSQPQRQRIVLQASTSELMKCLSDFLQIKCSKLINFKPSQAINWLRSVDRTLLVQGWQEIAFINPANVVFLYMLLRELIHDNIDSEHELQRIVMTSLYLSYAYMGNEISYPLQPFLCEQDDHENFWDRTLYIINLLSSSMLRLNAEPSYFAEVFSELKSYQFISMDFRERA